MKSPRYRLIALLTLAAIVLVGCQAQQRTDAASAASTTITATSSVPTTTARASLIRAVNELGKTKINSQDADGYKTRANITVLAYNDDAAPGDAPRPGFKYVAIQVKLCPTYKNVPDEITVSWDPWTLDSDDGDTYQPADSYSPATLVAPLYPNADKPTPIGTCRKGWIPFSVPRRWIPDYVEYRTEAMTATMTWRLRD